MGELAFGILAGVLVVSGIGKLGGVTATGTVSVASEPRDGVLGSLFVALTDMSEHKRSRHIMAVLEICTGIALIVLPSGPILLAAALLALGQTLIFAVYAAVGLLDGQRNKPCNCFGSLTTGRIGPNMMVRNLVLLGLAAICVITASTLGTSGVLGVSDRTAFAVSASISVMLVSLWQSTAQIRQLHPLSRGHG